MRMMMHHYQLTEHKGGNMEARFIINGKRVSRALYDGIKSTGHSVGVVNCFHTTGKDIGGGAIRRTNHCTVSY